MQVTLTPQAENLLRIVQAQHPEQSPAEILEEALAEHIQRETGPSSQIPMAKEMSPDEIDAALDRLAQFSDKIPLLPDEAFTREGLYQDHD